MKLTATAYDSDNKEIELICDTCGCKECGITIYQGIDSMAMQCDKCSGTDYEAKFMYIPPKEN